jgi:glutamine synthetase
MGVVYATANPYLVLTGMLGAVLAGVRSGLGLGTRDCTVALMTEAERKALRSSFIGDW